MSDWNKVEQSVEQPGQEKTSAANPPEPAAAQSAPQGASTERDTENTRSEVLDSDFSQSAEPLRSPLRYTAGGRRRGRYRFAAPLGLLVILLTVVGAISMVVLGVRAIQKSQDDSALREELLYFLQPVALYNPAAFADANQSEQDALLLAAIWRVTDAESIRLRQDSNAVSAYALDDLGRMLIPVSEIEQSYATLFGAEATIYHHTIGDEGQTFTVEYDKEGGVYHVPSMSSSMYVIMLDTVKKKGDKYQVRVGYVLNTNIAIDDRGKEIPPTADMAEYFQTYTLQRVGETGWKIVSVADESTTTKRSEASDTTDSSGENAAGNSTTSSTTTAAATTTAATK